MTINKRSSPAIARISHGFISNRSLGLGDGHTPRMASLPQRPLSLQTAGAGRQPAKGSNRQFLKSAEIAGTSA
jgi:hypothetical protein